MGGIYLSGGSGTGKTTFCNYMNSKYNVELVTDVIRNIHNKYPLLSSIPTNERQFIIATEYLKVHQTNYVTYFLSDRSILNVLAFWNFDPNVVSCLDFNGIKPDLVILLPVPPLHWYQDHITYFIDPIRYVTYKQRAGITEQYLTHQDIADLFHKQDLNMYDLMLTMCENLKWDFFVPNIDLQNFQSSWQNEAENKIIKLWFTYKEVI